MESLAAAISFEAIAVLVLGAGSALVGLFVIIRGVRIVLSMVRDRMDMARHGPYDRGADKWSELE